MNVALDEIFGCELWTGRLDRDGYAFHGRDRAHRVAWVREYGPIADGLVLDHACRRRHCIALHHLELVTASENELRKSWAYRCRITRCRKGHDMSGRNGITTPEFGRICRTCNTDAAKERATR